MKEWQTLIGVTFGTFLAIIVSILSFFIKNTIQKIYERKESIRRIEICLSQTLTDIITFTNQLNDFIQRAHLVARGVNRQDNLDEYKLDETNFPPIMNIYFDEELPRMKIASYYLHNKILITYHLVRWANGTINQFREDFEKILRKNELLVSLKAEPGEQRLSYYQNLTSYLQMVEKFLLSLQNEHFKSVVQTKVYNLKLMQNYYLTLWKFERTDFRYYKSIDDLKKSIKNLDILAKINLLIEDDVNAMVREIKDRIKKNNTPS